MKFLKILSAALLAASSAQAAAVGGVADVTIFDRSEGRQLPIHWHEGRAVVSVDGVNVITGETASPAQSGYLLSPWRTLDLQGFAPDPQG